MSLFDSFGGLVRTALGSSLGQQIESSVLSNVLHGNTAGGLSGILQQLQQAGFGQHIQSWIGNGSNMQITPDEIRNALGQGQLAQMAQAAGISPEMVSAELSKYLPQIVDRLTPHGTVPPAPPAAS